MKTLITLALIAIAAFYLLGWAGNVILAATNYNGNGWMYGLAGTGMGLMLGPIMRELIEVGRMVRKV